MDIKSNKDIFELINKLKKELDQLKPQPQQSNKQVEEVEQSKDNKNLSKKSKDNKDEENQNNQELSDIEKLELSFVELIEKNQKLEEDKLMAIADNQNTVKRFQNEYLVIKKYGGEKLASNILPAIDMFRSVISSSPENPEIKNYLMGFEMIINQIDQALSNSGVSIIEVKEGDDFNPEIHSAIEQIETDKYSSGKITNVISNGYKLHDRVIKHANVKVAK
ncbi:molecular chaperone GrpE (heat shock protein) [Spiroplasma corruscae]|uniref:Protein GrpE n=1 Tax=Spiroplasma corruscae TaxID=216934 RepID=A0A222EPN2_9MOLU|nr:nucleotide exchange factor GrpE [Spiroplasma corruscae]ASP28505.1 molecular chaperone GrpE (heat shock protein) [Spiroplasma corruscae]